MNFSALHRTTTTTRASLVTYIGVIAYTIQSKIIMEMNVIKNIKLLHERVYDGGDSGMIDWGYVKG